MRGRLPSGPEYVQQLTGSDNAKERVQVVLETLAGTCRVQEACERLQISEPRFEQLRRQVLQAAVERLEPRTRGRPPRRLSPAEQENQDLRQQIAALEMQVKLAQTREQIALVLPNAVHEPDQNGASVSADQEKKTRRHRL